MKEALVSVVVPCFNVEMYIEKCLRSIINQTYQNIEILMVDDGSTDGTVNVINRIISEENGGIVRLISQTNAGASAARNKGIENATGKYLAFVDSDDWVSENYIFNMVHTMEQKNVDLCIGGIIPFINGSEPICGQSIKEATFSGKIALLESIDQIGFQFINLYGKMYKLKLIKDHNVRLDERLKIREDLSFSLDYYKQCESSAIIDCYDYYYRMREGSLIHRVTLPTECKYGIEHFFSYFDSFSYEEIENALKGEPGFTSYCWEYGLLDRFMANVLEGKSEDNKMLREKTLVRIILETYYPKKRKDKILYFAIQKRMWICFNSMVRLKYLLLKKNGNLYQRMKALLVKGS